jgi:hypothetical protein
MSVAVPLVCTSVALKSAVAVLNATVNWTGPSIAGSGWASAWLIVTSIPALPAGGSASGPLIRGA